MSDPNQSRHVQTFLTLWGGQTVSLLGSRMTSFALILWVWQLTGQATALSLIWFFVQVPQILMSPFAGVIVDRWNRKQLMIVGDAIAGLTTIAVVILYLSGHLQIWHLYVTTAISAAFGQIQELAYSASVALMVPKSQYDRASSLEFLASYGSRILAPAFAGFLYPIVGLLGILTVDLITFVFAVSTVLLSSIPQPKRSERSPTVTIWQDMRFGFQTIFTTPGLLTLLLTMALFQLMHDLGDAVYAPMILARSGNDATVFASVSAAAGLGGVTGALLMTTLGGFKPRIQGVLGGMIGAGLSKLLLSFGRTPLIWMPTQFCSSFNFPLLGSSEQAIWLAKVKPEAQGRVFAARWMLIQLASPVSFLIGGPLADYVFEPAMQPGGFLAPLFGSWFGTGVGAGMAVLYAFSSLSLLLIGIGGFTLRTLRRVETLVPDHDAIA